MYAISYDQNKFHDTLHPIISATLFTVLAPDTRIPNPPFSHLHIMPFCWIDIPLLRHNFLANFNCGIIHVILAVFRTIAGYGDLASDFPSIWFRSKRAVMISVPMYIRATFYSFLPLR